jgi:O-antigen/teichoic acid export membrane protein
MIRSGKEKIRAFFNKGHERTVLTKKNIAASFAIKGITILISFILIPMTINYVNSERNGIWLTLYSMVIWLNLFDIGFGNGMKNKLAEAKAKGETALAKKYVSSTYAIVGLICLFVFILFCLINPHLDWLKILKNVPPAYNQELSGLVWIFMTAFCFSFVLNLLKSIVAADQRPAIGSFLDMLGQLLTFLGIFILSKTTPPSLISLGLVTGFAPVVVFFIASIVLFNTRYKDWKPSLKFVNFKLAGNMLNLGIKFFIATCASFMVTQTLPFLIQRMANPVEVTNYNTAFRLFSVMFNIMGIIILPYWSSFTDAYSQKDFAWMKKSIAYLYKLFAFLFVFQLIALALSPVIYHLWVNHWIKEATNILNIPFFMSSVVCLYICMLCWLNICIYPINGIGKVKLQVYSSVFEMLLLIPVAVWLGHKWGASGVVLAPILIYIPRMIWAPIQLKRLVNNKSSGIWNE